MGIFDFLKPKNNNYLIRILFDKELPYNKKNRFLIANYTDELKKYSKNSGFMRLLNDKQDKMVGIDFYLFEIFDSNNESLDFVEKELIDITKKNYKVGCKGTDENPLKLEYGYDEYLQSMVGGMFN